MTAPDFDDLAVVAVYKSYPAALRTRLLALRSLIFETAAALPDAGPFSESLKWGEPSYHSAGGGTPIRIAPTKTPGQYGLFVHCQTSLIREFRDARPDAFIYSGSRALLFDIAAEPDGDALREFITAALTYHRRKKNH